MLITTHPNQVSNIEALADEFSFLAVRIGTTGGSNLEISVYHNPFISASLASLQKLWAAALESTLHDEVTA
jgi:hypothetical protein